MRWATGALVVFLAAGVVRAADEPVVIYPAETAGMAYSTEQIARFDLGAVKNVGQVTKATLHVYGGKALPGAVEVRPVMTAWGGAAPEFVKRELEGVWREADLKKPDWDVARDLFLLGDPNGEWASLEAKKWTRPGGDYGAVAATVQPAGNESSVDLATFVKQWAADPAKNFGLHLKFAAPQKDAPLTRYSLRLELEGPGLAVDDTPKLANPPAWLPKTYKAAHPRLPYPSEKWLVDLKADAKRLDALCKGADSFDPTKGHFTQIPNLVLAAKLAPTPARAALLSKVVDCPFPNHGGYSICYALSVLYDWGYDLLTPADRRRLAYRLERMCTGEEGGSSDTIISPFNDVGTSRFGCGLLWAALAIYPDVPAAEKHLWRAKSYYIDTSLPVWHLILGDDGGYWHELHSYYLGTCIGEAMARVFSAWTAATGQDLYKENPWLEKMLYFGIYSTRPDMYRIRIGDIKCGDYGYGEDPIFLYSFPALVQRYDNPFGRWWGQRVGGQRLDGVTPTEYPWGEPFAKDAKVRPWDSLPPVRMSDGLGVVNLRSGWTEDATSVWFKCGPSFWSHSHYDSGSFEIYRRGALAIDAGNYAYGYGTEHYVKYARLSIAHNVVTVTNPNEAPWKGLPNDGGQRFTAGEHGTPAPYSLANWKARFEEFDTGRIVAFQTTPDFTYVAGDTTNAYNNSKSGDAPGPNRSKRVRQALRSLLFLPPDHVVVFDQVESVNKDFPKRFLLHTINEPKVAPDGLITVERADTCFRFSAWDKGLAHAITATADHPFFKEHPDCKWYAGYQPQLYQYDGVMFVRPLLPAGAKVEVIGGPGKECFVLGKNYDSAEGSEVGAGGKKVSFRPYTGEGETGRYRLEISPGAPAEKDLFLTVIQVGEKSKGAKPTAARFLGTPEMGTGAISEKSVGHGAGPHFLLDLGGGRKATVTFADGVGGHLKIEGGKTAVDLDLSDKVQQNTRIEK